MSDLFAAGRRDYPVTVKTGYSVAEVVLSPTPIEDVAVATTDALMVLAPEGRAQAMPYLSRLAPGARIFALADIESFAGEHPIERLGPAAVPGRIPRDLVAFAMTAAAALRLDLVPLAALHAAIEGDSDATRLRAALDSAVSMAARKPSHQP